MAITIGAKVDVQGRFTGTVIAIDETKEFPYAVKDDVEGFIENCSETELWEVEER